MQKSSSEDGKITNVFKSAADINYSALPAQKRWDLVQYITLAFGICAIIAVLGSFLGVLIESSVQNSAVIALGKLILTLSSLLVFPLILTTVVCAVVMLITNSNYLAKFLPDFAHANGFINQPENYGVCQDGTIFSIGDTPRHSNIITGVYRGYDFELFEHSYYTGSGKSRQQHRLTVLAMRLPKKVPHLVIDSKIEDKARMGSSILPVVFNSDQKLTLEGDFSQYFDVYCPRNYHVSALSLLTPDVMHTFLTKLHQVDVELVNDRLYIYDPDPMNSKDQIFDMFEAADAVIDEWSAKLSRANIYASKVQEQIHSGEDASPVRLKRGGVLAAIVVIVLTVGFQFLRIVVEVTDNPVYLIPFALLFFIGLILALIQMIRIARRKRAFVKRYGKIKD